MQPGRTKYLGTEALLLAGLPPRPVFLPIVVPQAISRRFGG